MATVFLTPAAQADIADAIAWYKSNAPHVIPRLHDAISAVMRRIEENPQQFPFALQPTRRAMLRTFPYLVVFRETDEAIYVIAVFHMGRDPGVWKRRS